MSNRVKVLLVDDERKDHAVLRMILPSIFELASCFSAAEAAECLDRERPEVVLLDIMLPDGDGIEVLRAWRAAAARTVPPVIMLTCASESKRIVQAMRAGAFDYLTKPYTTEELVRAISQALLVCSGPPASTGQEESLIGVSPLIGSLRNQIRLYGPSAANVLVLGESGTGKELVARSLHAASGRAGGPFVARNCGAVPEQLFETEFFGAERGAFTDARSRAGSFESANGGTLFLDEVGELGLPAQAKILRAMEDGEILRLGSNEWRKVDVRIIAATNRNLKTMLAEGGFREDLYYRLNVLRMEVAPLRDRPEDVPVLVRHFLARLSVGALCKCMTPDALRRLMEYSWPGNIRELRNVIERAHCLCAYEYIGPEYLSFD